MDHKALTAQRCKPLKGAEHRIPAEHIAQYLDHLPGWVELDGHIAKNFQFSDYDQVLSFVGLLGWLAQREDHHPEITFSYNRVRVVFSTHSVGGLTLNDFICAAKIEALRDF